MLGARWALSLERARCPWFFVEGEAPPLLCKDAATRMGEGVGGNGGG